MVLPNYFPFPPPESAMGTKINAQTNSSSEYVQSVKELTRISVSRITTLKIFNIAYIFTKDFWKERKHLKVVHNYSRSIIKKRRETLIDLKSEEVAQREDQRVAFLDLLLQAHSNGTRLNDEEIQNEVDTFMFEVMKLAKFIGWLVESREGIFMKLITFLNSTV